MKRKYDLSSIMTRAWKLFKNQDVRTMEMFSECLKKSWKIEKTVPDFNSIYKKYHRNVLNYISYRLNGNIEIATEITNDVFMQVNKHLSNYNPDISGLSTWLYSIAKNMIIDYYRRENERKAATIHISDYVDDVSGKEYIDIADDVCTDANVQNQDIELNIYRALSKLNLNLKEVAIFYFMGQMKYTEIAELCQLSMGSVKGMINRCREILQGELKNVYSSL